MKKDIDAIKKQDYKENKGYHYMSKTALITGANGQDGSWGSESLLNKGYEVWGLVRRSSTNTHNRLYKVLDNPKFHLIEGDVCDSACMYNIISEYQFSEIYNMSAQSHVGSSFNQVSYTMSVDYFGVVNILEAIRKTSPKSKIYQCSTSELFGSNINEDGKQSEKTEFKPNSPYAIAKLAAHHLVRVYRESYGIFACGGILFNHTGIRRGELFISRKITKYIGKLIASDFKLKEKLQLGNLDPKRDFGSAKEYFEVMWLMLQQETPRDFVVGTGKTFSIEQLLEEAFHWGGGLDYKKYIEINPEFVRVCEVPNLCADSSLIQKELGWIPKVTFSDLIHEMVDNDIKLALKEKDYN
jgi:GDPmannose 4,6-dehydratase